MPCLSNSTFAVGNNPPDRAVEEEEVVADLKNYSYADLSACALSTIEMAKLGPEDYLEPCVVFDVHPSQNSLFVKTNRTYVIPMVQVTPSNCGDHRDGAVTGVQTLNDDNDGRGVDIGFQRDHYVNFHLVSVVAGNPSAMAAEEYERRHLQILESMIVTLDAPYIVGTCSFASAIEKVAADRHSAIVMAQVGPPSFYRDDPPHPYLFGIHIDSDTYPLPNTQSLQFWADQRPGGPAAVPVRVIYRTQSDFFYSTCRSAIEALRKGGFTDLKEILYDHTADHDHDGEINQLDVDFLNNIADQVCPPRVGEVDDGFHPALFVCTLTEQDVLVRRWLENGCRPVSTWMTASTWGWANDNPDLVPYFQGGGQWHEAFTYSDKYFGSGVELLEHNERKFGYYGTYDQVASYAIPVLYSQHLIDSYRVIDHPDPLADFAQPESRELLRRDMLGLKVDTIFGPISFDDNQRNNGRSSAGTQWLPRRRSDKKSETNTTSFVNMLVAPFLQAEAASVVPSSSALNCSAGTFVNETSRLENGSILESGCTDCPIDTFLPTDSTSFECQQCPAGSSTNGLKGQDACFAVNDNLMSEGVLVFGYVAVAVTFILSIGFLVWIWAYRHDAVVKISQIEFLVFVCIGAMISSSTIVALSFQAGSSEDTSQASAACTAAPFLYVIGWAVQYSSLTAKTYRLFLVMRNNKNMRRVTVTFLNILPIPILVVVVNSAILIAWTLISPLVYERSEEGVNVDEESGVITFVSAGSCVMENDSVSFWAFAGPIIGFHVTLLIVTNALLYSVREVSNRYQEQKYIGISSLLMFEILIVGVPVLVAVRDNPTARHIALTGIITLDSIGILCFTFVPKILFQRAGLGEGVGVGESIMRETYRRASTREKLRQSSLLMSDASLNTYSENMANVEAGSSGKVLSLTNAQSVWLQKSRDSYKDCYRDSFRDSCYDKAESENFGTHKGITEEDSADLEAESSQAEFDVSQKRFQQCDGTNTGNHTDVDLDENDGKAQPKMQDDIVHSTVEEERMTQQSCPTIVEAEENKKESTAAMSGLLVDCEIDNVNPPSCSIPGNPDDCKNVPAWPATEVWQTSPETVGSFTSKEEHDI